MRKIVLILVSFAFAATALAQMDFSLAPEDIAAKKSSLNAKGSAGKLLDSKPKKLEIKTDGVVVKRTVKTEPQAPKRNLSTAPFGLYWGATIKEVRDLGVTLAPLKHEEQKNVFEASSLPNPISDFAQVELVFGAENELSRIIAYGKFINDDAKASKVLELYGKYVLLLENKYGKGTEVFVPKVSMIEKTVLDEKGKEKKVQEKVESTIGGDNFLSELKSGESVLYSRFEGKDVGTALGISVDKDSRSFIVIDYKNLGVLKKREQKTLEAL